ncbi:MAG TPA: winged helix-turn-helix domain-containing protein [Thermoanaerobaculia bacterium]|nr:winged helix-turn-helix domain-containing protein [Thermoanaerobaculia bacterium]
MAERESYRFGDMTLDVAERRLSRGGRSVPLAPKGHDLLVHLVRNAGRLVTKGELLEHVWAGSFVEEGILSVHVSALRRALGDDRRSRRYIETVSRAGYRFIAPVQDDGARDGRSLAVLPAWPAGPGTSDAEQSVGLALADAVIARLGSLTRISVRPTRAVRSYADLQPDPAAVGRSLGVDAVIVCKFEKTPERIRVAAELLRSRDGVRLWSGAYDELPGDGTSIPDAMAEALAAHFAATPLRGGSAGVFGNWADVRRSVSRPPCRLEVYELIGRGRAHLLAFSRTETPKAIAAYEAAIGLDPAFAAAHAGLAMAFCQQAELRLVPQAEAYARAKDAALRALAVDDACADAQVALAAVSFLGQWDWVGAERALQRALEINPNHTEATVLYGRLLDTLGRLEEGLEMKMRALERDPLSPLVHQAISMSYWHQRRYEDSIRWANKTLELDAGHLVAREHLAGAYWALGDFDRHMAENVKHAESFGVAAEALEPIKQAYARGGRTGLVRWLLETQGTHLPAIQLALLHGELGDLEAAMRHLARAIDGHESCLVDLAVAPQWDRLRESPDFQVCLARMGLLARDPGSTSRQNRP